MGGWAPAAPAVDPSVKIPEGMQVAGMGRRIGAWILDYIFVGILAGLFAFVVAIASGAVSINQQVIDQYDEYATNPFGNVTAPFLDVEMGRLAIVLVLYVALAAVYFILPWLTWGASPAQKMLGLKVADASTGNNLRLDQAAVRWFVLVGATELLGALTIVLLLDWMAKTPTNEWLSSGRYGSTTSTGFGPGGGYTLLSYLPILWLVLLVIVTGVDRMKRGWHDKVSGSIVLGPVQYNPYQAYAYPGGAPAWPPQPAGAPPAWPPQPAGAPPAWPPQPAGAPPQAPGYPPQAPGYPPSAYPGYPGYPGYPQQPGQPPVPPVAPPAVPDQPAAEPPAAKPKRSPRKKAE